VFPGTPMLSVITDFGCSKSCPYCIYRQMMLPVLPAPKDYYERLELAVRNFPGEVFSISGGGDPLNGFESNTTFWNQILQLCQTYNRKIDIHTAYLREVVERLQVLREVLHKIVVHCFPETWEEDKLQVLHLQSQFSQLRINFVIEPQLDEIALDVERFCSEHQVPFSYRQMVGSDLQAADVALFYTDVASRSRWGRYVKQDDYNVYFTPQGELKLRFMEI